MINVVVPIIDKPQEYSSILQALSLREDVRIIVGVREELEDKLSLPSSAVVKVYKNQSKKEEIINSLKAYLSSGRVVICRRPFNKKEFDSIAQSDGQITYFQSKRKSGFKEFFKNLISNIVKFLFGVNFFDGDISLIGFDEDMGEVLGNVNSLSYATRVDRWRGVEHKKVEAEKEPIEIEGNKQSNIKMIIFSILSFVVPVVVTILVAIFTHVSFVIGMLLFCFCLLGVVGSLLTLCTLYFNNRVGKRYFEDAQER